MIVAIHPDPESVNRGSVEFCTPAGGGGRSRHTLKALRALYEAMEKDNAETPRAWRGRMLSPEEWKQFQTVDELHEEIASLRAENERLRHDTDERPQTQ